MAAHLPECAICDVQYDSEDCKPLFLVCGHSYCMLCLLHMEGQGNDACPRCREPIGKPVDQLQINFDLIPPTVRETGPRRRSSANTNCRIHNFETDHFCADCDDIICRKCARLRHEHHQVEMINDIIGKDELVTDLVAEFQNKIESNVNHLNNSRAISGRIHGLTIDLHRYVRVWNNTLTAQHLEASQDLEAWRAPEQMSAEEKRDLFEKLRLHWRGTEQPDPDFDLLSSLRTKLEDLDHDIDRAEEIVVESTRSRHQRPQRRPVELLPDSGDWAVAGAAATQSALASVQAGHRPASLTVVSPPTDPIPRLPQVLKSLGVACYGKIKVMCLEFFWAPSIPARGRLQAFIEKHGRKVSQFYGSPDDALAVSRASNELRLQLGIRLADMKDVDRCSALTTKPSCVSCIRGLTAAAGGRMQELEWGPWRWHFPDLQDGDVDWACDFVRPFNVVRMLAATLYLPRCQLTEEGVHYLLQKYPAYRYTIYCEPVSLSAEAQSRLAALGQQKGCILHWTIPLDDL